MKRKLFIALAAAVTTISIAITILAHCGSTWIAHAPTFGPQLADGCTASNQNLTTTTKTVITDIHWTVGQPRRLEVTDSGQNKRLFTAGLIPSDCVRCFPIYDAPHWVDVGNGVTEWRQQTWMQTVGAENQCLQGFARNAIVHRSSMDCTPNQQTCEGEFSWFWNPFSDSCQEEAPPSCDLLPELCENGQWSFEWCGCVSYNTPIIIDLKGDGIELTNAESGVAFNLNAQGGEEKLAWTTAASDDAWLALDRNNNGNIDDGTELFGDVTAQPTPPAGQKKNGFRALAEYDKTANGGNGNGWIEAGDSIFSSLRLWRDTNRNGLTDTGELRTLTELKVTALELDYKDSRKTDRNGNQFSFRAKVKSAPGEKIGRWAWDVYLVRSL